jgi:ribonuclease P/MRP protein subunit RPP40
MKEDFDIIYFHFQRAFDKVPHDLLLHSLSELNLRPSSLSWFASFLQDRTQRVVVGKAVSVASDVTSGVPQGSVISPTLFCIFIDSLLRSLAELVGSGSYTFADDFKFITSTSSGNYRVAK